jgi:hypothetical protein
LIVLGTPSGVFVHSDSPGIKKLMAHSINENGSVNEHWHIVEPTNTRVGETQENDNDMFFSMNRARAVKMGLDGMGYRSNCFLVMSIPNKQDEQSIDDNWVYEDGYFDEVIYRSCSGFRSCTGTTSDGISNVARVSTDEAVFGKAKKNEIKIVRASESDNKEPIVITIMLYHTVQANANVINVKDEDIVRGIKDIKSIYNMCDSTCKLSQATMMLHELTKTDIKTCVNKFKKDPFIDKI